MNQFWPEILSKVLVELIVAGITAIVTAVSVRLFMKKKYKQKYSAAAKLYSEKIGRQIEKAASKQEDIEVHARAIVSIRNDLKGTLQNLSGLLNSDIDRLEGEVREFPNVRSRARAFETVRVLQEKWPIKADQIEIETRKLMAELGLEPD